MDRPTSHPTIAERARDTRALAHATEVVPLGCPTREVWIRAALSDLDALLDDHAQCELKAATNALAIVGRHPEHDELVKRMASLAKEEMVHYRMVRRVLLDRGGTPSRPVPNPYMKGIGRDRRGGRDSLLDDLLVCALIEARSCERFVALVRGLEDDDLADGIDVPEREALATFYGRLARSESGHATLFVRLAESLFDPALVHSELARRSEIEATTLETLPVSPRMHGGHRDTPVTGP